ncbi:MAG: hypothetical protein ACYSW3_20120 [Planctomycetota bacterium]|jgi:hypothetical protein
MGLNYDYPKGGIKACAKEPLKVRLDKKVVGEIRKVKIDKDSDGYQYFPKGQKTGGAIFNSVPEVQNSLLSIQPTGDERERLKAEEEVQTEEALIDDLKETKKENKKLRDALETATTMLTSVSSLLDIQAESKTNVNLMEENVDYMGTEYDGVSLHGEIASFLESL